MLCVLLIVLAQFKIFLQIIFHLYMTTSHPEISRPSCLHTRNCVDPRNESSSSKLPKDTASFPEEEEMSEKDLLWYLQRFQKVVAESLLVSFLRWEKFKQLPNHFGRKKEPSNNSQRVSRRGRQP